MYIIRLSVLVLLVGVQGGAVALATQQQQTTDAETLFRAALSLYEQQKYDEALVKATDASGATNP